MSDGCEARAASRGASATRLFNRDFVLLWQGQLVSQLGNQAFVIALAYWTMELSGSATMMALLMIGATVPATLLGPLAGSVADRHSRKRIIVVGDLVRGVLMLSMGWLAWSHADQPQLLVGGLAIAAVVSGLAAAVFNPAVAAALPDLVPDAELARANSLTQMSAQGAAIAGQAAGGVLYQILGAPVLLLVDGISFIASAGTEAWIDLPEQARVESSRGEGIQQYLQDARDGLRLVWRDRALRLLILAASVINFVFTPLFVLLPFYVRDVLLGAAAWYGFLLAALSAGSIIGLVWGGSGRHFAAHQVTTLRAAFVLMPLLLVALALNTNGVLALLLLVVIGVCAGIINVSVITLVQVRTPPEYRGRVLSVVFALAQAAMPVGLAIGGLAGDLSDMRVAAILATFGGAGAAINVTVLRSAELRHLLAHSPI